MIRADALNSHVYPVRTEMTDTQQIPISHICDLDESESKGINHRQKLIASMLYGRDQSERFIVDKSSTEEIK